YFKDMVEYTDKIVGKLNDKLEELGLKENTIFIFTGDNGTNKDIVSQTTDGPYPGGKGTLKDNGNHVPLVINWPATGVNNSTKKELVEFSDFLPTFADAAGTSIPEDINGISFYNLISNQDYDPRESIFIHYWPRTQELSDRAGCFARTINYKLYSTGEFFDMKNDKWEKTPLDINSLNEKQEQVYQMLKTKIENENIWDFNTPRRIQN
ncbi:MAG: sulfatase-like hydrolase/transferase, partial [Draconibacterium sp.]|nr:sulfatase-like hydrolase/transferase [Draconibacterium sp.]